MKQLSLEPHNIDVERRLYRGIENLFKIYWEMCDIIHIYNVFDGDVRPVYYKNSDEEEIYINEVWQELKVIANDKR